jgi:hypothetical protein
MKAILEITFSSFSCVDQTFKMMTTIIEKFSYVIVQKLYMNDDYILYFVSVFFVLWFCLLRSLYNGMKTQSKAV